MRIGGGHSSIQAVDDYLGFAANTVLSGKYT